MILAIEFYKRWQGGKVAPHRALAETQRWMHQSSPAQKRDAYAHALDAAGVAVGEVDWGRVAHPFFWAAFTQWGA